MYCYTRCVFQVPVSLPLRPWPWLPRPRHLCRLTSEWPSSSECVPALEFSWSSLLCSSLSSSAYSNDVIPETSLDKDDIKSAARGLAFEVITSKPDMVDRRKGDWTRFRDSWTTRGPRATGTLVTDRDRDRETPVSIITVIFYIRSKVVASTMHDGIYNISLFKLLASRPTMQNDKMIKWVKALKSSNKNIVS